jgi:hypothetical protein
VGGERVDVGNELDKGVEVAAVRGETEGNRYEET